MAYLENINFWFKPFNQVDVKHFNWLIGPVILNFFLIFANFQYGMDMLQRSRPLVFSFLYLAAFRNGAPPCGEFESFFFFSSINQNVCINPLPYD